MIRKSTLLILSFLSSLSLSAQSSSSPLIHNFKGHASGIERVIFSQDNRFLLSLGAGNECILWDIQKKEKLFTHQRHPGSIADIALDVKNNIFISAGGSNANNNLKIWNIKTGREVNTLQGQVGIRKIALSADGRVLLSGGDDQKLMTWDLRTGKILGVYRGHSAPIHDLAWLPNQDKFISLAYNSSKNKSEIKLWDRQKGNIITSLGWEESYLNERINALALSPDGRYLASGGEEGDFKIWDIERGQLWKDLSQPYTQISDLQFSADGQFVASISRDQSIKIWDIQSGQKIASYLGHFKALHSLAFSSDGQFLASGGEDQVLKLWRAIPYRQLMEARVKTLMQNWLKKDKFEKSEAYEARVGNPQNRNAQIQKFSDLAADEIAQRLISPRPGTKNYPIKVIRNDYDADREVFRLELENLGPMYMPLPLSEAPAFERAIQNQQLQFENCQFALNAQEDLALKKATLKIEGLAQYAYVSQEIPDFQLEYAIPQSVLLASQGSEDTKNTRSEVKQNSTSYGISEVDYDLPKSRTKNPEAVAVVIGNRNYQNAKPVDFALNDSRSIRNYLLDVMGYSAANIIYIEDASYTDFKLVFGSKENYKGKLYNMVKPNKSDVFVFYSGHGAPGLNDKKAYFVPVECDPQYVEVTGFPSDVFYNNLAKLPARSVVVSLDACFSGENIYDNISPIIIKSKGALGLKSGGLLASSAANQVSTWYPEKRHGMFTYFFLKAIHNKNADENQDGKLTLLEIHQYINDEAEGVPYYARRLHGIVQSPVLKGQNPDKVLVEFE